MDGSTPTFGQPPLANGGPSTNAAFGQPHQQSDAAFNTANLTRNGQGQQQPTPQQQQFQQQQQHGVAPPGSVQLPSGLPPLPPGLTPEMLSTFTKEKMSMVVERYRSLSASGLTPETSHDMKQLQGLIGLFQKAHEWNQLARSQQQARQAAAATAASNANGAGLNNAASNAKANGQSHSLSSLSPEHIAQLRAQIHAYRLIHRGLPLPSHLQQAVTHFGWEKDLENEDGKGSDGQLSTALENKLIESSADVTAAADAREKLARGEPQPTTTTPSSSTTPAPAIATTPAAAKQASATSSELPYVMEMDESSAIYPYNAYTHPLTLLRRPPPTTAYLASKQQKLLVPSLMPSGLDPYLLLEERNRYVETRIQWRIEELERLPSTLGDDEARGPENVNGLIQSVPSDAKIRALIELKALQLRDKQAQLREDVVRSLNSASALVSGTDRTTFRRNKKQTLRDARLTESIERKQRMERDKKVKQKQLDYVQGICAHGRELVRAGSAAQDKSKRLGKLVLSYHVSTEKEEQKRIERLSKERLKALKNDDEEAYLKLIDTAKDTRITHLIRQTDSYLDSLAQAVVAQQNDDIHRDAHVLPFETEDGAVDESLFGAEKMAPEPGEDPNKVDYYSVAHKISEKVTTQPTILVGGKLKEYQLKGLQWMVSLYNNRLNGILADEMGLGKTIQTLSLITFLIEKKKQPGPYLVIVPLSTITNWTLEFEKWAPSVSTVIYKGTPQSRRDAAARVKAGNFQVLITTFEYIIREKQLLGKIKWIHMIIDEGHRMKNAQSKLSQTLSLYYTSRYRLILTGTPLQNNLPELWALLNFVLPKIFNSVKSFDEWFNTPFANTGGADKMDINEEEQLLIIRRLHKVLRPFLLRRLKKDVESELPDKVEKVIKCKMSALQQRIYTTYRKHGFLASEGLDKSGKTSIVKGLSNTVMQLRKICNHPFVLEAVEETVNPMRISDDRLWRCSGKFELLDRILPKLFATDHRVLIFFQMVNIMHIFEDYLIYRGYGENLLRLDGSTKADDRTDLITKFNAPNSPYKIFILSTRAGGLGLNLQTADTVIIYDSDWNPHADLQAQDRAHRIGQKKVVKILRLVTSKSIEEDILATAQGKLAIDGKVIQAGKFDNKSSAAEQEALLRSLLEAEVEESDEDDTGEMGDDEINEILARGDTELPIFQRMDREREQTAIDQWAQSGLPGPKPERLMTDDEVPEVYRRDVIIEPVELLQEEEGRGQRVKERVQYDDGLTEEQFLNALEDEEDDLQSAMDRRRRRATEKASRQASAVVSDDEDSDDPKPKRRGKASGGKRGGVRGKRSLLVDDDDDDDSSVSTNTKRKRGLGGGISASATPSIQGGEEDDDEEPVASSSKRRKTGGGGGPKLKEVLLDIYNTLGQLQNEEYNQPRTAAFEHPVDRNQYPSYYTLIRKPVFLSQIKRKITQSRYPSPNEFKADIELMVANAKIFNQPNSWVYEDAEAIEAELARQWALKGFNNNSGGASNAKSTPAPGSSVAPASSSVSAAPEPIKFSLKLVSGGTTALSSAAQSSVVPSESERDRDDDEEDSASDSD